jgi:transcriptional regulator with XRE-family HTH domain
LLNIGLRLRHFREQKGLSQTDVGEKTGLGRNHISRLETGDSTPSVETAEKFACAFEVPIYQLFYDGEEPPELPNPPKRRSADKVLWGDSGKDARMLKKFCRLFSKMKERDLGLLLRMAKEMSKLSQG